MELLRMLKLLGGTEPVKRKCTKALSLIPKLLLGCKLSELVGLLLPSLF